MTIGFVCFVATLISVIALKAGKRGIGLTFGFIAFVAFVAFLKEGLGFNILDWGNNPSVPVPDNIPLPGDE